MVKYTKNQNKTVIKDKFNSLFIKDKVFKPLKKQKFNKKKIFGFDIETYGTKNDFLMCSLVWLDNNKRQYKTFNSIKEFLTELKKPFYRYSLIFATNLQFDFFGVFKNEPELKDFDFFFRGGHLLYTDTYIHNNEYTHPSKMPPAKEDKHKSEKNITFLDTLNYAQMSVKQLGKIIGVNKLPTPPSMQCSPARKPKNQEEKDLLEIYNIRDSEVSLRFAHLMIDTIQKLGGTFQKTIASCSINLLRTKYLKEEYKVLNKPLLKWIQKGYYGGRTETFKRGKFSKNLKYYDFNSLYPSVMVLSKYPNPNTARETYGDLSIIKKYEGMSEVEMICPKSIKIPLLPTHFHLRNSKGEKTAMNKLLFATGLIKGVYTNLEIRRALELGYTIKSIKRQLYTLTTCNIFDDFINTLYKLRLKLKSEKNSMQLIVKLIMNANYGKYGQKWEITENVTTNNFDLKQLMKFDKYEFLGKEDNFIKTTNMKGEPKVFSQPMWACYVTAYARLKLHNVLIQKGVDPIYCDTDSIITRKTLKDGDKLGELELENEIIELKTIKPKMYAMRTKYGDTIKVKGVNSSIFTWDTFTKFLKGKKHKVSYPKFIKFKESLRRLHLDVNEIVEVTKSLDLEDTKRDWQNQIFDQNEEQDSIPIHLTEYDYLEKQTYQKI